MKNRFFASFLFVSLCFSSFSIEASSCYPWFKKRKTSLSEELNNPELSVKSVISPISFSFLGDDLPPQTHIVPSPSMYQPGQPEYYFTYTPAKKKKKKGQIILSFNMNVDLEQYGYDQNEVWRHWIYWESNVEDPPLHTNTAKAIFNEIYMEIYGMSLDGIIEQEIIPKTIAYSYKNELRYDEAYEALDLKALLFKDNKDRLRHLIAQAVESPHQTSSSKNVSTDSPSSSKMGAVMRTALHSSREDLKRKFKMQEILSRFDTRKGRKTLDMSRADPDAIAQLLAENRTWRESITPDQVRQLDVRAKGIQYVFVPKFKHFLRIEDSETINIDTLSDSQIMEMDRDTFLRDVFLAGELYVNGYVPPTALDFITQRKREVKERGHDAVMEDSLSKQTHNFIAKKLGFDTDFENMKPSKRRALFKKEIEMMTDISLQINIVEELVARNIIEIERFFSQPQQ